MAAATRLQQRTVALATALALLCVGVLVRWHETEVAHAHEQSGAVVHAQELAEHHEESTTDHLHGREAHGHTGDCALLAMTHESLALASPVLVQTAATSTAPPIAIDAGVLVTTTDAYRLAPKTSPPSA